MKIPQNVRERMYYVIVMPTTLDGQQGPVNTEEEPCKLSWEVWDQTCSSFGNFDFLADAIQFCEERNKIHYELLGD